MLICIYNGLLSALTRLPESPLWLLGHRGQEEARRSLAWLRPGQDVGPELELLEQTMENHNHGLTMKEALSNLSKPHVGFPFLLIIVNFAFVNFSGQPVLVFYAVEVFQTTNRSVNKESFMEIFSCQT